MRELSLNGIEIVGGGAGPVGAALGGLGGVAYYTASTLVSGGDLDLTMVRRLISLKCLENSVGFRLI